MITARDHRWKYNLVQDRCALLAGELRQESEHNTVQCSILTLLQALLCDETIFSRFRLVAERVWWLRRVRLSACISMAPTGHISVKFGIDDVYVNVAI